MTSSTSTTSTTDTAGTSGPGSRPGAACRTQGLRLAGVTLAVGDGTGTIRALDDVDLEVDAGEFVAIIVPSGAGKTSLLSVAGALAAPTSGSVHVLGQDLAEVRRSGGQGGLARFRRENLGFVVQSGNLLPALTAADQLRLAHRIAHRRGRSRSLDPLPFLEAVGMEHRAGSRPGRLSGGERQRIGIARALVDEPGLLLVDEPTAALDRQRSQDIVALLAEQCRSRGIAGVMVSHDHDVLAHCDRVLEMVDGQVSEIVA